MRIDEEDINELKRLGDELAKYDFSYELETIAECIHVWKNTYFLTREYRHELALMAYDYRLFNRLLKQKYEKQICSYSSSYPD